MQHLDEGTIHSWLDGALSADEAARVEAHVKECPQCAAAVAEARGFIAGASRILTALDNAPRGVIPVVAPKKRVDPIVWRVAATLMIVAAGTLVVVKNSRNGTADHDQYPMIDSASARTTPRPAAPIVIKANPPRGIAIDNSQLSASPNEKRIAETAAPDGLPTTERTSPALAPQSNYSAKPPAGAQTNIPLKENVAIAGVAGGAVAGKVSASSGYAQAAPPNPQLLAARMRVAAASDAAREPELLKEVGHPRTLGAKVTLYEVAPGDTVTLTEAIPLDLSEVVVTSAATVPVATQATGKSAAAPAKTRVDAAAITSMADSQHAAAVPPPAPVASAPAPTTSQMGMVNSLRTIRWADPATGHTLALTGRMPEARLQQIKVRIERERAAAAAKKKP